MPAEKIINHPIIGDYKIIKKTQSRTIRLSVNESKGVRITIPIYTSFKQASNFLESNIEWVCKSLQKEKQKAVNHTFLLKDRSTIDLINGRIIFFEEKIDDCENSITISSNKIEKKETISWLINFPKGIEPPKIIPSVISVLRDAAKEYLPARTQYLSNRYGFKYNKLFLKNNKSNWGSCSSLNNINLNIHLMRLPSELCDYIILHELTHLKHRNHSKEFHKSLDTLCSGREKEFSKKLKQFCPTIHFQ